MVAVQEKTIYGIAPLVSVEGLIEFIGSKHFDYGMFICAGRKAEITDLFFEKLEDCLHSGNLKCNLKNIPVWSSQYLLFKERAQKTNNALCRELVTTATVRLTEYASFEDYRMSISASLRKKSIKPCLNSDISYSVEPYSEMIWQQIEGIYERRMEDRIGKSSLSWAKDVIRDLNAVGLLRIGLLKYREEYTAFIVYFVFGKTYSVWLTAFRAMDGYRFGHYIRYCLIQEAFSQKIEKVDMMRGAYQYKREWDAGISCNIEFRTFSGFLGKTAYSIKMQLRQSLRDIIYQSKILKSIYKKLSKLRN